MLKVTVAVVCYNERENIESCIESLLQQDYSGNDYEILFVDNDSTDGTQEIIQEYAHRDKRVRLIVNPVRGIAGSRNLALQKARYDYVAFIDADCLAPPNWLATLVSGYERYYARDNHVVGVGGSNVPPQGLSRFYNVLTIFLNTYLGSHGSTQGMRFQEDRPVEHIPTVNVFLHRKRVLQIGAFDATFGNIGEDQDLSYRLAKNGLYYYYLKDATVVHRLRSNLKLWTKNMYVYGIGRMWLMLKHPDRIKAVLLLPFLLVAFSPLVAFAAINSIFLWPIAYFVIILIISIFECFKAGKIDYTFDLFILYISTHFAYGIGQWAGLLKKR